MRHYKFNEGFIKGYVAEIRQKEFFNWDEIKTKIGIDMPGIASMEIGNVAIDLNVRSVAGDNGEYINKLVTEYFMAVKGDDNEWFGIGYPADEHKGYDVNVNWDSEDYVEYLEMDMLEKIMKAVREFGLKINKSNYKGYDEADKIWEKVMNPRD